MTATRTLFCLIAMPLLLLAGCSPHPATGNWAAAETGAEFTRLEVTYEGRANLFAPGEEKAGRHCFWGGESAQVISMTCKPAFDTDIEEHYRLVVTDDGTASLMRNDQVTARFSKQP